MNPRPIRPRPPSARLSGIVACVLSWHAAAALAQPAEPGGNDPAATKTDAQPTLGPANEESAEAREARETAQARALYEEGVAAAEHKDWSLAADRFRRAQSLRPSSATAFNLATALEHLGKLVEAAELVRPSLRSPNCPPEVKQAAEALVARIEPRLATLTIRLVGDRRGTQVDLDGAALWPSQLDVGIPVDPGFHDIVVRRGSERIVEESVRTSEGRKREVVLALPDPSPGSAPDLRVAPTATTRTAPVEPTAAAPAQGDSVLTTWWFWTAVGVLAVGTTVAVVVIVSQDDPAEPAGGSSAPLVLELGR